MELLHTCYRITDIDRSVAFYEALGFEDRRRMPIREEAINVFMGLPGDDDRLELTSWTWKVGTRTTPGRWGIVVSCGSAGTLRTSFVVS